MSDNHRPDFIWPFCSVALLLVFCHERTLQLEPRKGLDVDIANAIASEASDKRNILNSIVLPRAKTKVLQQEAHATHESHLPTFFSSSQLAGLICNKVILFFKASRVGFL